ncbi:hypothetical protein NQZ68_033904, partial [Dissostichus eleginoides]
ANKEDDTRLKDTTNHLKALGEDEEEEEIQGKDNGTKEDRDRDSGTFLSVRPNREEVDKQNTVAERSVLMENVYPRLYLYCKQRGYDFRMVDLRGGVCAPVAERHDTVELHLFVGQKHEARNLPSTIPREAFEAIVRVLDNERQQNKPAEELPVSVSPSCFPTHCSSGSSIQDFTYRSHQQATISGQLSQSCHNPLSGGEETRLSPEGAENQGGRDIASLQMWYKLDEKCLPPVYRFLPISSPHPDLLTLDPEQRRRSREGWGATCYTLRGILQRSTVGALGQEEASLLLRTVLDWETGPPLIPDLKNDPVSQDTDLLKAQLDPDLNTAHQHFMDRLHKKSRSCAAARLQTCSLMWKHTERHHVSQLFLIADFLAIVMPWDIRTESKSAMKRRTEREKLREKEAKRRLEVEKYNSIDQYLLSGDEQVVVCFYFAHHLNVFSMASQEHLHALEDETSLLSLHPAALTSTGSHLVTSSYTQEQRGPHLCLWDLHRGTVGALLPLGLRVRVGVLMCRKSERYGGGRLWIALKGSGDDAGSRVLDQLKFVDGLERETTEKRVAVVDVWSDQGVNKDGGAVRCEGGRRRGKFCVLSRMTPRLLTRGEGETEMEKVLKVWDPFKGNYRSICGYGNLTIDVSSKLYVTEGGSRAILLSGQLSLWDLQAGSVLSVLSLDAHVHIIRLIPGRQTNILLGLSHSPALLSVRVTSRTVRSAVSHDEDLFGESSSSEEEEGDA